jgi:hypothetical protein
VNGGDSGWAATMWPFMAFVISAFVSELLHEGPVSKVWLRLVSYMEKRGPRMQRLLLQPALEQHSEAALPGTEADTALTSVEHSQEQAGATHSLAAEGSERREELESPAGLAGAVQTEVQAAVLESSSSPESASKRVASSD